MKIRCELEHTDWLVLNPETIGRTAERLMLLRTWVTNRPTQIVWLDQFWLAAQIELNRDLEITLARHGQSQEFVVVDCGGRCGIKPRNHGNREQLHEDCASVLEMGYPRLLVALNIDNPNAWPARLAGNEIRVERGNPGQVELSLDFAKILTVTHVELMEAALRQLHTLAVDRANAAIDRILDTSLPAVPELA